MYHIEQLRSKELTELQSIAQNLGVKGIKSLGRDEIIYRILDGQAFQSSQSGAPAVVKEESRMNRRNHKRARISSSDANKVYTATGDKAVKLDKNEPKKPVEAVEPAAVVAPVAEEAVKENVQPVTPQPEPVAEVVAEPAEENSASPKKRGRKPKNKAEKSTPAEVKTAENETIVEAAAEPAEENSASPKKRGRKPKNKAEKSVSAETETAENETVAETAVEELEICSGRRETSGRVFPCL